MAPTLVGGRPRPAGVRARRSPPDEIQNSGANVPVSMDAAAPGPPDYPHRKASITAADRGRCARLGQPSGACRSRRHFCKRTLRKRAGTTEARSMRLLTPSADSPARAVSANRAVGCRRGRPRRPGQLPAGEALPRQAGRESRLKAIVVPRSQLARPIADLANSGQILYRRLAALLG